MSLLKKAHLLRDVTDYLHVLRHQEKQFSRESVHLLPISKKKEIVRIYGRLRIALDEYINGGLCMGSHVLFSSQATNEWSGSFNSFSLQMFLDYLIHTEG